MALTVIDQVISCLNALFEFQAVFLLLIQAAFDSLDNSAEGVSFLSPASLLRGVANKAILQPVFDDDVALAAERPRLLDYKKN